MDINKEKLVSYITKLRQPKVLVIGDLAMDEMIYGDAERISREAPVLILQHSYTKLILGGASNAAHNVSTLNGNQVSVIGVMGEDYQAGQLIETFKEAGIDTRYVIKDKTRKTTTKTRISGSISTSITQQIVRLDRQTNSPISEKTEEKVLRNIEKAIPHHDAVILSDYHIGTLTPRIINRSIELANKYNKIIVVDAQRNLQNYKNVTSMTPNLPDTQKSVGFDIVDEKTLQRAGDKLLFDTEAKFILITCGADGMFVAQPNKKYTKIPVFNKSEVFDVTGAGDTVTAVYTLALAAGADAVYAALIGNVAASLVVRQFGCATTTVEELLAAVEKL
ncbi:bifunctional hydroxymethylpyrimidine kinase/phosphomethylpyrimidine kinase [Spirochaetes bacterium]|uniref:Bifunctional hydroxymethylpyrimidine kinase/phosphomethylpyrimidine kinase n=1 Tax=Candidatus Scatousia excrementipullorum TaxID=2840936 RepID=A0A9D9GY57_9BACT|nr:bifunctional hydroxymethylpyrimidine kinase/phosphomethylpyrimidine kinase [Candidatus Scatousia excrementipullorum]